MTAVASSPWPRGRPNGTSALGPAVRVIDLGRLPYATAWDLQRDHAARLARGEAGDTLFLVEHDPVVTLGRGTPATAPLPAGLQTFEVERGGEATWHGPGQLVGYPVLDLRTRGRDVRGFLRALEALLIGAVVDLGVRARRRPGQTGVWVGDRKLASIGIAVRRWITFHGFALNVAPVPGAFEGMRPCGLAPEVMTSLSQVLERRVSMAEARRAVVRHAVGTEGALRR